MSEIEAGEGYRLIDKHTDKPREGDQYLYWNKWRDRPKPLDPWDFTHTYRRRIPAKPEAMPSLVDSVKRIRHFATGSCDMPLETRLKCIAKECEASLSKFVADWREAQDAGK
jgi:hypothetical protein